MELTPTQGYALALAAAATGAGGILDGADVRLFVNDQQPVEASVTADFDPTTYTGHADKPVTWLAPSIDDQGVVEVVGTVPEFRPTNDVTPNTVFGAIVLDGTAVMMYGGRFEGAPLPMESATDSIVLTLRYRPSDQSLAVVIS